MSQTLFLLERTTNYGFSDLWLGGIFSKIEFHFKTTTTKLTVFVTNDKVRIRVWGKPVSATISLTVFQFLKGTSDDISGDASKSVFFFKNICSELSQYLEDLHNLMNQYFPDEQGVLL